MRKRARIALIMGMIMTISLTACQKSDGNNGENNGQERDPLTNSLSDSPEFQACAEWWSFLDGYDTSGEIIAEVGDELVKEGYEYEAYNCYSKEMEDKVDEICEKYGLSKLGGFQVIENYSELCSRTGLEGFCENSEHVKHNVVYGYMYADGTFFMEGNVTLVGASICEASYQFAHAAKGSFNSANLDLGELTEYNTRNYTTEKGENVILLCGMDTHPYIIVERQKSFIVINVLGDLSDISDVNDERLEMLADAFDFAAIP